LIATGESPLNSQFTIHNSQLVAAPPAVADDWRLWLGKIVFLSADYADYADFWDDFLIFFD
jgi:hypothetical protein